MNKKLNIVIRTLGVLAAIAAGVFAYLLKGKIETAMTATNFAVVDAEVGAAKEFAPRMAEISAKTTALLTKKRERIIELEGNKKDLEADVADKKTKIEGLTANVATLEGERADLTRKRDELTGQLAEANGKKDALAAELKSSQEDLVKEKEKVAVLFTKEQLEAEVAKANKAQENMDKVKNKYAALRNEDRGTIGAQPDPFKFPEDPTVEATTEGIASSFGADTIKTRILVIDPSKGIVCFTAGENDGLKKGEKFEVLQNGVKIGAVSIAATKASSSVAEIHPVSEKEEKEGKSATAGFTRGGEVTLSPFSGKLATR
jgi:peptidoglycan hydrolase CwlO-like protein